MHDGDPFLIWEFWVYCGVLSIVSVYNMSEKFNSRIVRHS